MNADPPTAPDYQEPRRILSVPPATIKKRFFTRFSILKPGSLTTTNTRKSRGTRAAQSPRSQAGCQPKSVHGQSLHNGPVTSAERTDFRRPKTQVKNQVMRDSFEIFERERGQQWKKLHYGVGGKNQNMLPTVHCGSSNKNVLSNNAKSSFAFAVFAMVPSIKMFPFSIKMLPVQAFMENIHQFRSKELKEFAHWKTGHCPHIRLFHVLLLG